MKHHSLQQGSAAWHAHRVLHWNAADAPAMLGCSPYETRSQLLHRLATGITPEVDAATQRRFDDGHRVEALACPLAEKIIGEDLAPVVGSEVAFRASSRALSASFDGLTLMGDVAFEHKSLNDELRAIQHFVGQELPKHYRVQMEQQLLVSGAEKVLFMASKWDGETLVEERHCWYAGDPALRAEILAGWVQFEKDLAEYKPEPVVAQVVAAPVESLPAVSVRMDGALTVVDNLPQFGVALRAFIERIPAKPSTDQEFADTAAACTALKKAADALRAAESGALASMAPVEEMRRLIADFLKLADSTRLAKEKMVEARKLEIRTEEVMRGKAAMAAFIDGLNKTIRAPYFPPFPVDFGAAIKGLRTVESVRAAIDQTLANSKIAANEIAAKIIANLRTLDEHAAYAFLFPDKAQIVLKQPDDFAALVSSRIAAHKSAEEKRAAELAEQAREAIRAEEAARIGREQKEAADRAAREEKDALERRQREEAAARAPLEREAGAAQGASQPINVVPMRADPIVGAGKPIDDGLRINLSEINSRIAPLSITAAGLEQCGFAPVEIVKASKLYRDADFPRICSVLIRGLVAVQTKQAP